MRIHMVGVGGISMRALARYLHDEGHDVTGCDVNSLDLLGLPNDPVAVQKLLGFKISYGHDATHVANVDQVVINSAITESHPGWVEVVEAKRLGILVMKRAQKIGEITHERPTVAITGTHGKSTTTGMAAKLTFAAGLDPFVMVGARMPEFDNQTYRAGSGPLILEADEFDRSFLNFTPQIAVVTNIEVDHLDYYTQGLPEIIEAFAAFMRQVVPGGTLIVNGDDANVLTAVRQAAADLTGRQIIRYGRTSGVDYQITAAQLGAGINHFVVCGPSGSRLPVNLRVPGGYNQENAAAVMAVGVALGISNERICAALEDFRGVGIRFEIKADQAGTTIISDYGHHPTEVRVTIAAAKEWFPGRPLSVVFQPHQHARTRLLFHDFVTALAGADTVYVTDIYGVAGREDTQPVSAQDLVAALEEQGTTATYVPVTSLVSLITAVAKQPGVYLMIGAGLDIRQAAEDVAALIVGHGQS